jgi:hypothetical protein
VTGSSNWRVLTGTPRKPTDADELDAPWRPVIVRDYERTVRRAEAAAEEARARLAAVVGSLR